MITLKIYSNTITKIDCASVEDAILTARKAKKDKSVYSACYELGNKWIKIF